MAQATVVGGEARRAYLDLRHREFNGDEAAMWEAFGYLAAVRHLLGSASAGSLIIEFDIEQVDVAWSLAAFLAWMRGDDPPTVEQAWDAARVVTP